MTTSKSTLIRNPVGKNPNLTLAAVERLDQTDEYGIYPKTRVISNLAPVVVRQENPKGPVYQEVLGYSFLLNSMKRPES